MMIPIIVSIDFLLKLINYLLNLTMKNWFIVLLLCLISTSLQARFQINSVFLTTHLWTFSVNDSDDIHEDVILNPNGKVYTSDNRTQYLGANWSFNEKKQLIQIQRSGGSCTMNAVVINQNPTFYPDVSVIGIERGYSGSWHSCNLQVVTS